MRWLVLSDIHANLPALEAVLADAEGETAAIACCGDMIGYGPDPIACLELLRSRGAVCVAGNHERMVAGAAPVRGGKTARRSIAWTRRILPDDQLDWLAGLPVCRQLADGLLLCHGTPDDPDCYVDCPVQARRALRQVADAFPAGGWLLHGHTHRQGWFLGEDLPVIAAWPTTLWLDPGRCALINPGSVGQARDRWLLARYALLDEERGWVEFRAVAYDVRRCRARMSAVGIPSPLCRSRAAALRYLATQATGPLCRAARSIFRRLGSKDPDPAG